MAYSNYVIEQVQNLRRKGFSIPEISRMCSLSPSTVLRYAGSTAILPEYLERWRARKNSSKVRCETNWSIAREFVNTSIDQINETSLLLVIASLYWAEGAKRDFSFCNSDPKMIAVFVEGLRKLFSLDNSEFTISLRLFEDLDIQKSIKFWSEVVGFNLDNRAYINIQKGSKIGKLEYGICRVRVRKSGLLLKKIKSVTLRLHQLIMSS
jgi:hypothetical protein